MTNKRPTPDQPLSPRSIRAGEAFARFVETLSSLRHPEFGCPWDLEQNHRSLKPYVIEEAHEVVEAIESDPAALPSELGDLLLQVVLHSQIGSDEGTFSIEDVVNAVNAKMVARHPHVFGDVSADSSKQVLANWEVIKQRERPAGSSILTGVPKSMPALLRAQRIGDKASRVGFDWPDGAAVFAKIDEELAELKEVAVPVAPNASDDKTAQIRQQRLEEELGDLLFAIAQLGRKLEINTEESLRLACEKFTRRFMQMESSAPSPLKDLQIEQLELLWNEVKSNERNLNKH